MEIRSAIGFPFRGPHAWANMGCLFVCFLIPIVGPIVVNGYLIQTEKILIQNMEADAPAFVFGKFSIYLQRGFVPFLVSLLLSLLFIPVTLPLGAGLALAMIFLQNKPAMLILVICVVILMWIAVATLMSVVVGPLAFKAGLEESFEAAFDGKFCWDYIKRVGLLTVGVQLLMLLVFFIPMTATACVPFVGPYAAMAVGMLIMTHLRTQLYLVYLERGGRAIAIKPEPVESGGFPVQPAIAGA